MNISLIPKNLVDVVWPQCEPLVAEVVKRVPDDIDISRTKDMLDTGEAMLIVISDGTEIVAINTLIVETLESGKRVLYIPITSGGRMAEWLDDFLELAKNIARELNCFELRGLSIRNAWLRKLKSYGWEESHVIIKCKVEES